MWELFKNPPIEAAIIPSPLLGGWDAISRKLRNYVFHFFEFSKMGKGDSSSLTNIDSIPNPPGYISVSSSQKKKKEEKQVSNEGNSEISLNLKMKKAWDVALGPSKSIPMNAIMMWLSGSSVQIFSIIIVVMLLMNPIKAVFNVQQVFEVYSAKGRSSAVKNHNTSLWIPKLSFVGLNLLLFGMGVYKCSSLGLLPTSESDWMAFKEPKQILRMAYDGTL